MSQYFTDEELEEGFKKKEKFLGYVPNDIEPLKEVVRKANSVNEKENWILVFNQFINLFKEHSDKIFIVIGPVVTYMINNRIGFTEEQEKIITSEMKPYLNSKSMFAEITNNDEKSNVLIEKRFSKLKQVVDIVNNYAEEIIWDNNRALNLLINVLGQQSFLRNEETNVVDLNYSVIDKFLERTPAELFTILTEVPGKDLS